MPRGLAIETSGRIGSLALIENGLALVEEEFPHGLRHAAEIVTRIDALCKSRGLGPDELDEIYVSTGRLLHRPARGSDSCQDPGIRQWGKRRGGADCPGAGAATRLSDWSHWIIVLDAKRDQIFTARFTRDEKAGGEAGRIVEVESVHLDSLAAMLQRSPRPVHLIGEGIPFHSQFVPADPSVFVEPPEFSRAERAWWGVSALAWRPMA